MHPARTQIKREKRDGTIDCPVAVVFGHPDALNWPGKGFADVGLDVSNGLWAEGFYADLIPSSEIALGNLKLAEDGSLQYGPQRYAAAALPPSMKPVAAAVVQQAMAHLKASGIEPQTPCTMRGVAGFPPSMMPKASGLCRLPDGTVIVASGGQDVLGDPIRKTIKVTPRPVQSRRVRAPGDDGAPVGGQNSGGQERGNPRMAGFPQRHERGGGSDAFRLQGENCCA